MVTVKEATIPYISDMTYDHVMSGYGSPVMGDKLVDLTISYTVQFRGFAISTEIRGTQFQNFSAEELINLLIDKVKSELP